MGGRVESGVELGGGRGGAMPDRKKNIVRRLRARRQSPPVLSAPGRARVNPRPPPRRRSRPGLVVPALDQQPLRLLAAPGPLQGEAAAQPLAVEDEDRVAALERLRPGHPAALLVGAAVPDLRPSPSPSSPSKSLCSIAWSSTSIAIRFAAGSIDGPFGTAHDRITPSTSSRRSKWWLVAWCSWTTKTPALTPRIANCSWPSGLTSSTSTVDRAPSALAEEGDQLLDRLSVPLGVDANRVAVASHPAEDAELGSARDGRLAQARSSSVPATSARMARSAFGCFAGVR